MHLVRTAALLISGLGLGYLVINLFMGADLMGRILLGLVTWSVLSLAFGIFLGRVIGFGKRSDRLLGNRSDRLPQVQSAGARSKAA
jgi:hypothetical protein